jgi:hypothetical protein
MNRDDLIRVRDWARSQVEARESAKQRRALMSQLPFPAFGHMDFMVDVEVKVRASTIRAMRSSAKYESELKHAQANFERLLAALKERASLLARLLRRTVGE